MNVTFKRNGMLVWCLENKTQRFVNPFPVYIRTEIAISNFIYYNLNQKQDTTNAIFIGKNKVK